ncbi:MAG: hypothetical protein QOH21_1572 [Acidobacteriota bacterium]|jgi:hypothetical protein|nr:hypothetical protein [Acidobacteriota bacterium]
MADQHHEVHQAEPIEPPISISRLLHILRAYLPAMLLALLAVAVGYCIVALGSYLFSPSERITALPFRLEFDGATRGEYPNGTKFSSAEIVSTPVLLKVFKDNKLDRYTNFADFTRSIFVLESNSMAEALASDYQARMADPRITPVDRDRIQREYEQKRASLSKNQFSINYLRPAGNGAVPEPVVRKILAEILRGWASFAATEQRVLSYRVTVLSPDIVAPTSIDQEPLAATHVLRTKTMRLLDNLRSMHDLPGADLARSKRNGLSLADVAVRLEEIVRFRLEPLLPTVTSTNPSAARRFLQIQLAYDQRQLTAQEDRVKSIREALDLYTRTQRQPDGADAVRQSGTSQVAPETPGSETVVLTDTFLDRLTALTTNAADLSYRQRLADLYRDEVSDQVPLQLAVTYDEQALQDLSGGGNAAPAANVQQQLDTTRTEIRELVVTMNEIYAAISRNLNPSTALYAASVPYTRIQRSADLRRLALFGVLVMLLAVPVVLILALVHHRVKREERAEEELLEGESV